MSAALHNADRTHRSDRFEPPEALVHAFRALVVAATVAIYVGAATNAPSDDVGGQVASAAAQVDAASASTDG